MGEFVGPFKINGEYSGEMSLIREKNHERGSLNTHHSDNTAVARSGRLL